ncbi:MAG: hypothetical protein WCT39_02055 [Candidatus Margulisiibacteriota bacterium]
MYDDRIPMVMPPMRPPQLVSGADVQGNGTGAMTEEGRLFLCRLINRLQTGGIQVFGDEEAIPFEDMFWPGIDLSVSQDDFQFIDYVGQDEAHAADWGDLSRFSVSDAVDLQAYSGIDSGATVDYSRIWETVVASFSSEHSFGEYFLNSDSRPADTTPADATLSCFSYLIGLVNCRRNWVLAMDTLGINPLTGAASDASRYFGTDLFKQAGGVNIQILSNYLLLRKELVASNGEEEFELCEGIAKRYARMAADSWINGTVLTMASEYYADRIATEVDLTPYQRQIENINTAKDYLDGLLVDGRLTEENMADAIGRLGMIRSGLNALPGLIENLQQGFGLVNGETNLAAQRCRELAAACLAALPTDAEVTIESDFSDIFNRLSDAGGELSDLLGIYEGIVADPRAVLASLLTEFSGALSNDSLAEDVSGQIKESMTTVFRPALMQRLGTVSTNNVIRTQNRVAEETAQSENDAKHETERMEQKQIAQHQSKARAEAKRNEQRVTQSASNNIKRAAKENTAKTGPSKTKRGA